MTFGWGKHPERTRGPMIMSLHGPFCYYCY